MHDAPGSACLHFLPEGQLAVCMHLAMHLAMRQCLNCRVVCVRVGTGAGTGGDGDAFTGADVAAGAEQGVSVGGGSGGAEAGVGTMVNAVPGSGVVRVAQVCQVPGCNVDLRVGHKGYYQRYR